MMDATTFVRSLSWAQAKIILVLLVERGGLTVDELSFRTGIKDLKTLRAACKELARSEFGLLVSQSGAHGRQTWMPAGLLLPMVKQAYFGQKQQPLLSQTGGIPLSDGAELLVENEPERGLSPLWDEKQVPERGNPPVWMGSIRLIDEPLSSCSTEPVFEPDFPTLENILNSLSVLRGMKVQSVYRSDVPWESLSTEGLERTPPKLALAWVVKAYNDRERLSNPVGMVLTRLKSFAFRSLPQNWQERLPCEYLQALGLPQLPLPEPQTADDRPESFRQYEQNIGPLTPLLADAILAAENIYPAGWIADAIAIAVSQNKRSWAYAEGVLKKWQELGRGYDPQKAKDNNAKHPSPDRPKPSRVSARRTEEVGSTAEPSDADVEIARQLLGMRAVPG